MRVSMFRRGQTWWARYSQDGRDVRRSLRTLNRKVAQDVLLDLELELRRGSQIVLEPPSATPAPKPPSVSIADFKREFIEYSKSSKRPKSHATDMGRLKEFIASLEVVDLADVTTGHATRFLAAKANEDKVSPTTILRYRETLHAFFAYARRLSYVRENPISAVPRPRIPDRDPRFLTLEQIDQLLAVVKGDLIAPLIVTLVFAGLRREEACWLTWSDLDLTSPRPSMRICAKTIQSESWLPKTKRNRTVPISSRLLRILKALPRANPTWVFPSPAGCRWNPDNLSARFRGLMKAADLDWNCLDLRHTFGSQLAKRNVSLLKIAQLMGNSPEIARRHYIRLVSEDMHHDVEFESPKHAPESAMGRADEPGVVAHPPQPPSREA